MLMNGSLALLIPERLIAMLLGLVHGSLGFDPVCISVVTSSLECLDCCPLCDLYYENRSTDSEFHMRQQLMEQGLQGCAILLHM